MTAHKKITLLTNFILTAILVIVFSVSFFTVSPLPIYGGADISAIYNGNRKEKNISLMFNVYENTDIVNGILDVLDGFKVKATFFVGGCWADDNGETLLRIVGGGNELANHGYFHKDHKLLDYSANKEEIYLAGVITEALSGVKPCLFAPPSGSFGSATLEAAFDLGYKVILWSKDTIDWRDSDKNKIISRATSNLNGGDFILMHPKRHTLECLPEIINKCLSQGYGLVTVSENIGDSAA